MYAQQREREALSTAAGSLEDYLELGRPRSTSRREAGRRPARVAQLTQKTNQFNLTTVATANRTSSPWCAGSRVLPAGRRPFGDHGLIGVAIVLRPTHVGHRHAPAQLPGDRPWRRARDDVGDRRRRSCIRRVRPRGYVAAHGQERARVLLRAGSTSACSGTTGRRSLGGGSSRRRRRDLAPSGSAPSPRRWHE